MATDERPTKRYQFSPGIELPAALTALGIECLDVSSERAIAVCDRTILDIVVVDGCLSDARTVEIGVIDRPADASADPIAPVETVGERLRNAVDTASVDRASADGSDANAV